MGQSQVKEESQTLGAKPPPDKPVFLDADSDDEEDEAGYLGADRRGLGEGEEFDSVEEVYAAGAEAAEKVGLAIFPFVVCHLFSFFPTLLAFLPSSPPSSPRPGWRRWQRGRSGRGGSTAARGPTGRKRTLWKGSEGRKRRVHSFI